METHPGETSPPPPSRAKLLEMWKASRGRASRIHDGAPSPATAQAPGKSSPLPESSSKAGLRDVYDHRGVSRAKSPPLVSPMKPPGAKDFSRRFLGKKMTTNDKSAPHAQLSRDPVMQSLAEKVSSLFPTPSSSRPSDNTEHNENLQNKDALQAPHWQLQSKQEDTTKPRGSLRASGKLKRSSSSPQNQEDVAREAMQSYTNIRDSLNVTEEVLKAYLEELAHLRAKDVESENRLQMANEEQQATYFLLEVQNQKIREFETAISSNRLRQNETISEKNRKHKSEIRKLNKERAEYEAQTNHVITQLNEQLNSLQTMAMTRIEVWCFIYECSLIITAGA